MFQTNQTQLMQLNLQRMIQNEHYFTELFQKNHEQQQPANPFRKRMFDKKLRRSTVSCGHYNSMSSNHNHSRNEDGNVDSSRISMKAVLKQKAYKQSHLNHIQLSESPLMIQRTQKMTLAQSRQSNDPYKQKVTEIINSFRLQLDYLQQKLHIKIDEIKQKQCSEYNKDINNVNFNMNVNKQGEINFMIQSLQKIVGFMIENCVNLQDTVIMYGNQTMNNNSRPQQPQLMRREMYNIYKNNQQHQNQQQQCQQQQESKQNISFGQMQNSRQQQQLSTRRMGGSNNNNKDKLFRVNHYIEQQQNININMPNTFFINNKLHSSNQKPLLMNNNHNLKSNKNNNNKHILQNNSNQQQSKTQNKRIQSSSISNNNQVHYHSQKQHTTNYYNSCPVEQQQQPTKSIYQTVLQERQMRIKMKKRLV